MPKVMCLYLNDSGTRNPDRKVPENFMYRDWFTLGGFLSKEEDEGTIETAHATFCERWGITYPLHSYDIRAETMTDAQRAWTRLPALPRTLRSRKRHSVMKQRAFRAPSAESKNTAPVAISTVKSTEFGGKY